MVAAARHARRVSPIHGYDRGRYKKYVGSTPVWVRGSSVLHHTADELRIARDAAAERAAEQEDEAAEDELDTTGIHLGDKLMAKGLAPHGETVWYEAVVLALRKRFPPIKVMYLKAEDGESGLPTPQTTFVQNAHVRPL